MFRQIALRITSVLNSKREKHINDIEKKVYSDNNPYCIFVNLGELRDSWFPGEFCIEATRILVGRGHLQRNIDINTGKQIGTAFYGYNREIINNNSSTIETDFFRNDLNSVVSAVIISTARLYDQYSESNTFVFLNPKAKNKIVVSDFPNIIYWKINYKNNDYVPRINGRMEIAKQ